MNTLHSVTAQLNYENVRTHVYAAANKVMNNPRGIITAVYAVAREVFKLYVLYNIYESALSDILCLKTFRHGTDPWAWLNIHLKGPDLKRGGTGGEARWYDVAIGSESPYAQRDRNRHYVVQDFFDRDSRLETAWSYIHNKFTLKYYSIRSTTAFCGRFLPLPRAWKAGITKFAVEIFEDSRGRIFGSAAPSTKLHLDPDRIIYPDQKTYPRQLPKYTFYADRGFYGEDSNHCDYNGAFAGACYTLDPISVTDLGICGILKNGLNTSLPKRIWHHKGQFVWGVTQLVAAVALTAFLFPTSLPFASPLGSLIQFSADNRFTTERTIPIIASQVLGAFGMMYIAIQF